MPSPAGEAERISRQRCLQIWIHSIEPLPDRPLPLLANSSNKVRQIISGRHGRNRRAFHYVAREEFPISILAFHP